MRRRHDHHHLVDVSMSLLLIAPETVHTALLLGSVGADLEAELATLASNVDILQGLAAKVLEAVSDTLHKVRNEAVDGALVNDRAGDTLRDLDLLVLTKVSRVGALEHGVNGAHTAVLLQTHAVLEEIFTGSLLGTSKHGPHHHCRGTKSEGLDDVTSVADTTISNARNTILAGIGTHVVHSRGLGTAHGTHLLGSANRARAHANAETVHTGLNKVMSLKLGDDVATNDLKLRELLLDPSNHLDLVGGVTLGGVDDDNVDADLNELLHAEAVRGTGGNGGTDQEALVAVLGGVREGLILEEIGAGHEGDELAVLVNNGELGLLGRVEEAVALTNRHVLSADDKALDLGHNVSDANLAVLEEVNVTVSHNADELAVHAAVDGNGHTGEAILALDAIDILHGGVRTKGLRVSDETVLEALYAVHHLALFLDGAVVVDETQTTLECHGNGHLRLRDGVHGRREERQVELDVASEVRGEAHIVRGEVNVTREKKDIIIGVTLTLAKHLSCLKAILDAGFLHLGLANISVSALEVERDGSASMVTKVLHTLHCEGSVGFLNVIIRNK